MRRNSVQNRIKSDQIGSNRIKSDQIGSNRIKSDQIGSNRPGPNGENRALHDKADRLLYNGQLVSPSGFVNAVGGVRRKAWRCLWILLPGTRQWALADTLRTGERLRRARKPALRSRQQPACADASPGAPAQIALANAPAPAQPERTAPHPAETPASHDAISAHAPRRSGFSLAPERYGNASQDVTVMGCIRGQHGDRCYGGPLARGRRNSAAPSPLLQQPRTQGPAKRQARTHAIALCR